MSFLGPVLYGFAIAVFLALVARAWFRTKPPSEAADELEPAEFFERCRLCAERARRFPLRVVRDESLGGFVRRSFGAPARYRVGIDVDRPFAYCVPHHELARAELQRALDVASVERAELVRNTEVELSHFELVGLDARLAELVAAHEHELERNRGARR